MRDGVSSYQKTPGRFVGELAHSLLLQGHAKTGNFRAAQADKRILRDGEVAIETQHSRGGDISAEALRPIPGFAGDLDRSQTGLKPGKGPQQLPCAGALDADKRNDFGRLGVQGDIVKGGGVGPVIDRDEGAAATIYPGAGLYVRLTVTADDKLLRDPILGQLVTLKDRADSSVADHRDATLRARKGH